MKVFANKFGQVVEKSFDFVLCFFGFVEAKKFRDSSEYSDCVQNVVQRVASPINVISDVKQIFFLQRAKRPRYEFSASVLRRTCKKRFSL